MLSSFDATWQQVLPSWVRARELSCSLVVLLGGQALERGPCDVRGPGV